MNFFREFIRNPLTIGAIAPSSKILCQQMLSDIDFASCNCIVEYGPGTGVITQEIINKKPRKTKFLAVEKNPLFYNELSERFANFENVHIINGSAEQTAHYLRELHIKSADYIISGLPFTVLPEEVASNVLSATSSIMHQGSQFVLFQYSPLFRSRLHIDFHLRNEKLILRNIPPAFVYNLQKKNA